MKRLAHLTSLVVTLGALSAACSGSIVTDGDEDDGDGGAGGAGGAPGVTTVVTTTGNNPPGPSPAISMLRYELDNPPSTSSSVSVSSVSTGNSMNTTSGGPGSVVATTGVTASSTTSSGNMTSSVSTGSSSLDPYDLVIVLGSELQQCEDPFATNCATQNWRVTISLPQGMQQIGTYDLEGFANWFESDQCNGGGGGTFWEGTITITSIDPSQVSFVLAGTNDFFLAPGNADGSYVAPRCF